MMVLMNNASSSPGNATAAEMTRDQRGEHGQLERQPGRGHRAREDVPPDLVGAEPVLARRALQRRGHIDRRRLAAPDQRADDGQDEHGRDDQRRRHPGRGGHRPP
jgi:hypothetical protein